MRKVKYLVAALLLMGATTTFTSCIDNDEPAGITELRGAKAALIRADEAYKLAQAEIVKVDIERRKVLLEREKLDMQLQQIQLEIEQAKSEYEISLWQNKKDSVIADFQGKLFYLQEVAAKNETAYLKALAELKAVQLVETDVAFAQKLQYIITQLAASRNSINDISNEIIRLNNKLLSFESNESNVGKQLLEEDVLSSQSKLANDSVKLAEFKKLASDYSTSAIDAQILEIEKQIIDIDKKVAELKVALTANEGEAAEYEQALSKLEVDLTAKNKTVTLDVPEAIESQFIQDIVRMNAAAYITLTNGASSKPTVKEVSGDNEQTEYAFTSNKITGLQLGTMGVTPSYAVNSNSLLSKKVENLSNLIKATGLQSYYASYEALQRIAVYTLPSLSMNSGEIDADVAAEIAEIPESDQTKVAAALEKVKADLELAKAAYDEDLKTFQDAYKAYLEASKAYGITLQLTSNVEEDFYPVYEKYDVQRDKYNDALIVAGIGGKEQAYETAKKAYDDAAKDPNTTVGELSKLQEAVEKAQKDLDDAKAKVPSTDYEAAKKALVDYLVDFYPKQKAFVGKEYTASEIEGVNDGKEFVISEKISSLTDEQFQSLFERGYLYITSYRDVDINYDDTTTDGACQTWIKASLKLYGGTEWYNVGSALNAVIEGYYGAPSTIERPLNEIWVNVTNPSVDYYNYGSAQKYVVLDYAQNYFSAIDTWISYAATVAEMAATFKTQEDALISDINKNRNALATINEPLRDTIYEILKLDSDAKTDSKVQEVMKALDINITNVNGEKQTLMNVKEALSSTDGEINITYTYYEYSDADHSLQLQTATIKKTTDLSTAVANVEKSIEALRKYIAYKQDQLAAYENGSHDIDGVTKAEYENTLANLQEQLEEQQAIFDTWSKAKDELIAAITADDAE